MGDSLVSTSTMPFGSVIVAAPSALSTNNMVPAEPTLAALFDLAQRIQKASVSLESSLNSLKKATTAFAGAVVAVKAIAGVAGAMDDTFQFRTVGGRPPNPSTGASLKTLRQKADALADAVKNKTGESVDPRKFVTALDEDIKAGAATMDDLLHNPDNLKITFAYVSDPTIGGTKHFINLWAFLEIQAKAVELFNRVRGDAVDRMAQEILEQHDTKTSVPAVSIAGGKALWKGFVDAVRLVATPGTSVVGNLPGPDSLSVALIKIFASNRLPKVAVGQIAANSLDRTIMSMLVDAVQLTDPQAQTLKGLMDDLKNAQAEVIRKAKEEADATAKFPDHTAKIARKSRQRLDAEENLKAKAAKASTFFEDTYGPNVTVHGPPRAATAVGPFPTV